VSTPKNPTAEQVLSDGGINKGSITKVDLSKPSNPMVLK
jgi:hypothetical protein